MPRREAEILARAVLLDGEHLGPGDGGMVQLRLEKPTAAMGGDRFVLRTYSPMRILAGGRIIDPSAPTSLRTPLASAPTLRLSPLLRCVVYSDPPETSTIPLAWEPTRRRPEPMLPPSTKRLPG